MEIQPKIFFKNNDPERAITPVLMFCKVSDNRFHVASISIGWWKWGIGFIISWKELKNNALGGNK